MIVLVGITDFKGYRWGEGRAALRGALSVPGTSLTSWGLRCGSARQLSGSSCYGSGVKVRLGMNVARWISLMNPRAVLAQPKAPHREGEWLQCCSLGRIDTGLRPVSDYGLFSGHIAKSSL